MSVLALARPELLSLKPYSSARMEAGQASVMLNANESPYAPFEGDTQQLNRYPDPQPAPLLAHLAQALGTRSEQIFVGRGSDEAIDLLVRAFCRAGEDAILISPPTFGMYAVAAGVQGARVLSVPLDAAADFAPQFEAMRAAVDAEPIKLVFVCSPNNPTGGSVANSDILALCRHCVGKAVVVVDEAYGDFSDQPSLSAALDAHANLAILRTLSKAYGLAGARIGVLLASAELIALVRRIMAPYPVPTPSLQAALAAFSPDAVRARAAHIQAVLAERERLARALEAQPGVCKVWPSAANFLAFRVDDATQVWRGLLGQGVIVRDISHYLGLSGCLRVSVGTPDENTVFLDALRRVLGE
ncbi:MAG: histidinol-phosphate transaminase [Lysobacterales bacterium]